MSRILKHGIASTMATVQGFTGQRAVSAADPASDPSAVASLSVSTTQVSLEESIAAQALAAADEKIALLEREVAALSAELELQATRQEQLQLEAFEKGRTEGSQQTREEAARRDEAIGAGITIATSRFAEVHRYAEMLALQLASAAVSRVLGSDEGMQSHLHQAINLCLARFSQQHPQALRVSRKDFPDRGEIEALTVQWPNLRIEVDPALPSGECVLQLQLGEVDIGLPGQVVRLRAFFDKAAQEIPTVAVGSPA